MTDLYRRIAGLEPTVRRIMEVSGSVGASMSISQGDETQYFNYGFSDKAKELAPTEDTIYPVVSLTKSVTAAALALLVDEGKLHWDALIKDLLPDFNSCDDVLQAQMTVADILCHRTGMARSEDLYISTQNNILISGKDSLKFLESRTRLFPFRGQYLYSNAHYELAGHVVEAVSGVSFEEFVTARIFKPLSMDRTSLRTPGADIENVAKCYNVLDDRTPVQIVAPQIGNDSFGQASGGIRSSVRDLSALYRAYLKSFNSEFATGSTSTDDSPFKRVAELASAKIPMGNTRLESSYGFGIARVQLPGCMGGIGMNPDLIPDGMPVVGKCVPSRLVLYHQGSFPGALAAVVMVPDLDITILIMMNTLALNEASDWIAQLVLEEVLGVPRELRNDYVAAAEISAAETGKWNPNTMGELERERKLGTSPRKLEEYVGTYWDESHIYKIEVMLEGKQLYWAFQGLESEKWPLDHYYDDTFLWIRSRDELACRGRWVDQGLNFWKAEFRADEEGRVDRLLWAHEIGIPVTEYDRYSSNFSARF